MSSPPDLDALSSSELKDLVIALLGRVAALERTVAAQRDEIARLKGVPGRPTLKPSGMENATQPKPTGPCRNLRARSADLKNVWYQCVKANAPAQHAELVE